MRGRSKWCAAVVAVVPIIALAGAARADHINGNGGFGTQTPGSVVVQPPPPVVVQPGQLVVVQSGQPSTMVVPAQMVQAEDLEANEVRAQTIYANKIQASEVRGAIHQTGKVKLDRTVTDLRAPTVVASVLYADTIKAHRVMADHIFVRDLERR
jgi:hypothetical protein